MPEVTATRHSSIKELPVEEWDRLAAPAGLYESHRWLRLFEGSHGLPPMQDGLEVTHIALRLDGELVSALPAFVARGMKAGLPRSSDFPRLCLEDSDGKPPFGPGELYPLMYCGAPVGFSNRLLLSSRLSEGERRLVLSRLVTEARVLAQEKGSRLLLFGHLPALDAAQLLCVDPELRVSYAGADCVLTAPSTFEDYLATLQHHARSNVRRDMRRFGEAGFVMRERPLTEMIEEAVVLSLANLNKYGMTPDADRFRKKIELSAKVFGDQARAFSVVSGEHTVAIAEMYHCADTLYSRGAGVEGSEAAKRAAVYFNLLFYGPLTAAPAKGIHAIHYGLGSLEAKVSRGCAVQGLWFLLTFPRSTEQMSAEMITYLGERTERVREKDGSVLRRLGWSGASVERALGAPTPGHLSRD